jgi:23S rRNA (cytidine1920-2'-O)/16S rRNA (cytidine1409-2'-O)-methyltransferase
MARARLDLVLLERQLASTRTKAQDLIRNGKVRVNGKVVSQPGFDVDPTAEIHLAEAEHPYVSRGGLKLAAALDAFGISAEGQRAIDIGQSTGGFTHCLLLRGAREVVGVEVGQGQLASSLKEDSRVRCFEHQDIRRLLPADAGAPFSLGVMDLSFISLRLVIPVLPPFLAPAADVVALVKPQFEVGPEGVGSGGIVRNTALREAALLKVEELCSLTGFTVAGKIVSPIEGGDGNQEFLLHLRWRSNPAAN